MTEYVKTLIAEARNETACICPDLLDGPSRGCGEHGDDHSRLFASVIDALEAAQQAPAGSACSCAREDVQAHAPAVDREALIAALRAEEHGPMSEHDPRDGSCLSCPWPVFMLPPEDIADSVIASGILRDVRDVQAEALEAAADDLTPGDDKVDDWGIQAGLLRARAQAIREARND